MKRVISTMLVLLFVGGAVSACGIKNAPEYVPDSEKTEKSKS